MALTSPGLAPTAFAQSGGAPASGAASGAATLPSPAQNSTARNSGAKTSFDFPLEPGDTLAVSVANHAEMNAPALVVNENGFITLPIVGNVAVGGKSIAQAQKLITGAFTSQLRQPQVSVTLLRSKSRQITLVGAVPKPGALDLVNGWRIGDAIDAAGGLNAPVEDIVATFSRGKGAPKPFNLASVVNGTNSAANLRLVPGDVISVKPIPGRLITVMGDVKNPGLVMLRHETKLANALIGAGGLPQPQKPETTEITLMRGGKKRVLSAVDAINDPGSDANIELRNGDVINVHAVRTQVTVMSLNDLVKAPGVYTLEGKVGVLRALLQAGNLTVPPEQAVVSVRRGLKELPVDIEKATYDPKYDLPLQNGDTLLVSPLEGPKVKVAGNVTRPGEWSFKKDATLLDALFKAGGLSSKPDQTRLKILRNNNTKPVVLNIDPVSLISLRDLGQNVHLQDGDLVLANPEEASTVFVSGEVEKPGEYQLGEGEGLIELLLRAGGPNSAARLKQVRIVHLDNTAVTVDASTAIKVEGARLPVELRPGDLVNVPVNPNKVLVMNAVQRPGYYSIPETGVLTVGDALLLAGGAQNGARLQEVAIVRRTPNGAIDKRIVPINQIANGNFTGIDAPLRPGDVVYVPQGKVSQSKLNTALSGLSALSIVSGVLR